MVSIYQQITALNAQLGETISPSEEARIRREIERLHAACKALDLKAQSKRAERRSKEAEIRDVDNDITTADVNAGYARNSVTFWQGEVDAIPNRLLTASIGVRDALAALKAYLESQ